MTDRIEELEPRLAELTAERDKAQEYLRLTHADWDKALDRAEAAEAKLDEAILGLTQIAASDYANVSNAKDRARATLAKISNERSAQDKLAEVTKERDEAMREALSLATTLHRDHYSEVTQWEPLNYPAGVISQIDNMVAGIVERAEARLVEVTAERDKAQKFGQDMVARAASGGVLDGYRELGARAAAAETRAEAAEAANLRFYRMALGAAADDCQTRGDAEAVNYGMERCTQNYYRARDSIRALPDPTPEQIDALRKGGE